MIAAIRSASPISPYVNNPSRISRPERLDPVVRTANKSVLRAAGPQVRHVRSEPSSG